MSLHDMNGENDLLLGKIDNMRNVYRPELF